ncbi:unnamed protein product [Rotaria sp. Silwood2]|nr:unnamed protein product [Rotaria sp. Silwood2]
MLSSKNQEEMQQDSSHSDFSSTIITSKPILTRSFSPAWLQQGMHWPPTCYQNKQSQQQSIIDNKRTS